MSLWTTITAAVVKPISDIATAGLKRKAAKDAIDGNIKMAKVNGENEAKVSIADWERLSKAQEDSTAQQDI